VLPHPGHLGSSDDPQFADLVVIAIARRVVFVHVGLDGFFSGGAGEKGVIKDFDSSCYPPGRGVYVHRFWPSVRAQLFYDLIATPLLLSSLSVDEEADLAELARVAVLKTLPGDVLAVVQVLDDVERKFLLRSGMLLTPRAPSAAAKGAMVLRQDVFGVILRVDQADRAVWAAIAILPGADDEFAVPHLHPPCRPGAVVHLHQVFPSGAGCS
jgi:hypothetical protein